MVMDEKSNEEWISKLNIALVFYAFSRLGLGDSFFKHNIAEMFALMEKYKNK